MPDSKFNLLRREVERILAKSPLNFEVMHSRLVLKYVLRLSPKANQALQIAAITHDIERAVTGITEKDLKDYSKIHEFKRKHALRSAEITSKLLKEYKYPSSLIKKTFSLIAKHEIGGGSDANCLKDADSLAFFAYNIPSVLKRNGTERTLKKIEFMYIRLSKQGQKIVKKMKFKNKKIWRLVHSVISELEAEK